ncbi:MAG: RluA family pseudouridine synthase [Candidatus Magasanikbacteria bacterium]|jgi:23S rRNA pseudouridine1911/1915/1917 synthase
MTATAKKVIFKEPITKRLDIFFTEKYKISRSQAQKMIEESNIFINNKISTKTGHPLKTGDQIVIEKKLIVKPSKIEVEKENKKTKAKLKIKIVSETKDYIVVEKPKGLLTHSTDKNEPDSLAAILVKKYPELKKVGDDPKRPGIVHRLDKEASGLLVVARTQKMFDHLKNQFKNRTIEKEYLVLVHGKVAKDWDEIKFPIERSRNNDRMAALPATKYGEATLTGKESLTEFWVEQRFVNFSLLRVKIHTGRMHQVRVHLLAYDHPVVGDPLYFQKKQKDKWDKVCGRLFLHCIHLAFVDLNNERQEFKSELPPELTNFLPLLK